MQVILRHETIPSGIPKVYSSIVEQWFDAKTVHTHGMMIDGYTGNDIPKKSFKEQGQLPQTDRASAFVVDRVKICLMHV